MKAEGLRLPALTIFGVDICSHYKLDSLKARRYALTVLEDGVVTEQYKDISWSHLLRLIRIRKPTFLAVDNIYELAQNVSGLRILFSNLPSETRVIQVTGFEETAETLQEAASKHGLIPPSKTSPVGESEACARIAEKGVGVDVKVLEDETRILVCRNVGLGPGGSSQSRYRRRIHSSILNITKKIEESLERMGLDYDSFPERSDFGLERACLHVYASKSRLQDLVKPMKGRCVQVKINPVYRNKIEFVPMSNDERFPAKNKRSKKNLILGVDPGTNCGLAILTLDATPLYLKSQKALTRGEITRIAMDYGNPVLIAADVSPAPYFVSKLAKMLNAVLFVPDSVLEAAEKQEIAQSYVVKYDIRLTNPHARDALVAAIKAFQHYKNKFEQVEGEVQKSGVLVSVDEVKALVVRGQPIQRAIELLSPTNSGKVGGKSVEVPEEKPVLTEYELKIRSLQEAISFYKEQVRQLKESNELLVKKEKTLEESVKDLKRAFELAGRKETVEIRREREYQRLQREVEALRGNLAKERDEVQRLEKRLETLRSYKELESKGDVVFLRPVETFTKAGLEKAYQLYDIKRGDTIMFLDSSGGGASTAEEIVRRGVRAVVSSTAMSHQAEEIFEKYGVVVVPSKDLRVEWVEGYPYVNSGELDSTIKRGIEFKKSEMGEKIRSIVEEYKRERTRNSKSTGEN